MIATKKNGAVPSPTVRVASYARKSVAEGPDAEFGSLEAQHEAVRSYVASQRSEGWTLLDERYEDNGFTGANIERPGFQRLLRDIEAGRVDLVCCYKIDRLSRSLVDFARLMELFERHGVTFVAVTQQFSTTSSMGRLTLNILMSFAEFERATIAERVRDKVHATRRRGLWTGGRVPLGYDVVEKRLVVNAEEAERVRAIFALYLELGSLLPTVQELGTRGWTTKAWTTKGGRQIPGRPWNRTSLHAFLTSPIPIGKIRAGSEVVVGQHEAIVDQRTWDAVQAQLSCKAARPRGWKAPKRDGALLAGLLSCACGASMIRSSTKKGGRRYHSYVCGRVLKLGAKVCPGSRAPAGALEEFVLERIRAAGSDPKLLKASLDADREARGKRRPALEAAIQRLGQERGRLEAERANVAEAIAGGGTSLVGKLKTLDAQFAEAEVALNDARRDLAALDAGALDPEELRRALAEFEPLMAQLSVPERARVLALLLERVTFHAESGEVEIRFRPGAPRLLTTCPPAGAVPANGQATH